MNIDASHKCLAKNWATFCKMRERADEIDEILAAIAREVIADIRARHGEVFGG